MALEKQTITLNLAKPANQKSDPKSLEPGTPTIVENAQFLKGNRLDKRFGYDTLALVDTDAVAITDLKGVIGTEEHLVLLAGDDAYAYSASQDNFKQIGKHIPCETTITSPDETSRPLQGCDSIHVGGITYYALLEMLQSTPSKSAYVWVMGVDEATGAVVFNPEQAFVNEETTMKLFSFNGQAYVFYSYLDAGGDSTMFGRKLNPTGIGAETELFDTMSQGVSDVAGNFWDVMNLSDTWMVFGYPDATVFGHAALRYFDGDFVEGTGNFAVHTEASSFHGEGVVVAMSSSGDRFFYIGTGGNAASGIDYLIRDSDGTANTASTAADLSSTGLDTSGVNGLIAFPEAHNGKEGVKVLLSPVMNSFAAGKGVLVSHIADDGTVTKDTTGFEPLFDVTIISKPWVYDGKTFFVFYRSAPNDSCYFFGCIIDDVLVVSSQILYGRAPDESSDFEIRLTMRNLTEISSGVVRFSVLSKDSITQMPGAVGVKMDFTSKELFTGVPYGRSMLIAGTNLHAFGGQQLRELNFWYAPRAPILTVDTLTSDGEITDGSHSVVVVYEFQDKNGYLHRSRPGPETTITASDGSDTTTIDVEVPNYLNSNMEEGKYYLVKIIPYRTLAGGSIYYREDYFENWGSSGLATPYVHNNRFAVETRTITLKKSDADLSTSAILYTTGGEIPPTPIPPIKYLTTWGSRIWSGGSARDEAIYYSKTNQTNLMPEFSELFSTALQDKPGRTTGLVGLSDKIIVSKRGRLYYSFGQGPNNAGSGALFSEFEEIPGVSGAVNGKSMVVNRSGVNYKSDKGIYTLSPGLETQYSGAAFEDEADTDIIKSITPIDSETIRYITGAGIISLNNYFGAWSKDSSTELVPIDACLHNNQFYVLTSSSLLKENKAVWKDDTIAYGMSLETGWISLGDLAGYQRFYRLFLNCTYKSVHTLKVSIAYDYGAYEDEEVFDPADAIDDDVYRFVIYPKKQKCEAFRFKIEEVISDGTAGTHESLQISFVAVMYGRKKGFAKLKVAQRVGTDTI